MEQSLYILIICSIACSILGVFLVLRNLSMVTDAISHSVLLGIVLAAFMVNNLSSIWIVVGAAIFGVLTVISIELLIKTRLVKNDASVGIVFPLFFSIGVLLVSTIGRDFHLGVDCVLMGEVIFAHLKTQNFLGISVPVSMVNLSIVLLINLAFVIVFFKELKLSSFDPEFSKLAGLGSGMLFYALMTLVSVTTVVSFESIGAILVIAFMVAPAASALLITKNLKFTLVLASVISSISCVIGYYVSTALNVSMSGVTAFVMGLIFVIILMFSHNGVIYQTYSKMIKRRELVADTFVIHLSSHIECKDEEHGVDRIKHHLKWSDKKVKKVSSILKKKKLIRINTKENIYELSEKGIEKAKILRKKWNI